MNRPTYHICLVIGCLVRIFLFLCFALERKFSNRILFAHTSKWDLLSSSYKFQRYTGDTLFLGFPQEERGPRAIWKSRQCCDSPAPGPWCSLGAYFVASLATTGHSQSCPGFLLCPSLHHTCLPLIPVLRELLSAIYVNKHIHANVLEPVNYSVCYPF